MMYHYPGITNFILQNNFSFLGLAFIGTLCEPGDSVSLVEEQGGFQSIGTAAHEIGHR